jgi:hypothetical protein
MEVARPSSEKLEKAALENKVGGDEVVADTDDVAGNP